MLQATDEAPEVTETVEERRMMDWLTEMIERGETKPHAVFVTLTPVLAQLLLNRNPVNRPLSKRNASSIASDIASGRWAVNGEPIIVSDTGVLNDGQHRCSEVVRTGVSIETFIVFGPKEETRFTVDTGKSKTASNFLSMKGRKYTHALAAAVNYHLQWRKAGYIAYGGGITIPTKVEIVEAAEEMPGIDVSVEFTAIAMKTIRCHAILAFCHYVFWKRSGRVAADDFMLRLIEGDGLKKGNPILYCRNRLLGLGRGATSNTRAELIFKCWNAFRNGEGIDHFKLTGGKLPKVER